MAQDFYSSEEYNYLEHHGILGMKWGKKNGPPYPLSEAKHDRIVEKYEKKRAKIAQDPVKLKKYADKYNFTNEEIETALKRFETKNKLEDKIEERKKQKKLNEVRKKLSKDFSEFEKYYSAIEKEEADAALNRLDTRNDSIKKQEQKKRDDKKKPDKDMVKEKIDITRDYLSSIASSVESVAKVSKGVSDFRQNWVKVFGGYSPEEIRVNWMRKHSTGKNAGIDDPIYYDILLRKLGSKSGFSTKDIINIVKSQNPNLSDSDIIKIINNITP